MSYTYEYARPALTVDAIVFRKGKPEPELLLIRRKNPPFKGMWALPGGFLDMNETPEEAVARELQEETGLTGIHLTQLHTFGAVLRDPRHRTITIAYAGIVVDDALQPCHGDDAAEAAWFPLNKLPELAFDHGEIIAMAIEWFDKQ